tara:strand:- start:332 stop:538 length:207 start_codon:yes stop_codon:yes gene_type:complete
MQTAEKLITSELSIEELLEKNVKLERIAEVAIQVLDTYKDEFASYNEIEYIIEKLSETIQEYELFLDR